MCSPEFLAEHPELKTPADLLDVTRITPSDPWWKMWWEHFGIDAPADSTKQASKWERRSSTELPPCAVRVSPLLTPQFWQDELADGRLVPAAAVYLDGQGEYWLVYPKPRRDWPKISSLLGLASRPL